MLNVTAIGRIVLSHLLVWAMPVMLVGTSSRPLSVDNRPVRCGTGHHAAILPSSNGAISVVAERRGSSPSESIPLVASSVAGTTEHPADPPLPRDLLRTERSDTLPIALVLVGTLNTSSSL